MNIFNKTPTTLARIYIPLLLMMNFKFLHASDRNGYTILNENSRLKSYDKPADLDTKAIDNIAKNFKKAIDSLNDFNIMWFDDLTEDHRNLIFYRVKDKCLQYLYPYGILFANFEKLIKTIEILRIVNNNGKGILLIESKIKKLFDKSEALEYNEQLTTSYQIWDLNGKGIISSKHDSLQGSIIENNIKDGIEEIESRKQYFLNKCVSITTKGFENSEIQIAERILYSTLIHAQKELVNYFIDNDIKLANLPVIIITDIFKKQFELLISPTICIFEIYNNEILVLGCDGLTLSKISNFEIKVCLEYNDESKPILHVQIRFNKK